MIFACYNNLKFFESDMFSRYPTKTDFCVNILQDFCVNILQLILLDSSYDTGSLPNRFEIYLIFVRKFLSSSYAGCCFRDRKEIEFGNHS